MIEALKTPSVITGIDSLEDYGSPVNLGSVGDVALIGYGDSEDTGPSSVSDTIKVTQFSYRDVEGSLHVYEFNRLNLKDIKPEDLVLFVIADSMGVEQDPEHQIQWIYRKSKRLIEKNKKDTEFSETIMRFALLANEEDDLIEYREEGFFLTPMGHERLSSYKKVTETKDHKTKPNRRTKSASELTPTITNVFTFIADEIALRDPLERSLPYVPIDNTSRVVVTLAEDLRKAGLCVKQKEGESQEDYIERTENYSARLLTRLANEFNIIDLKLIKANGNGFIATNITLNKRGKTLYKRIIDYEQEKIKSADEQEEAE